MNYKLMAADIDGTLINSKGELTPTTAQAIRSAAENGLLFTLSTGRPIMGVERFLPLLAPDAPIITYNGAMIVRADTREILFEQGLSERDARLILSLGRRWGTTMCIWSHNRLYGNLLNEKIQEYKKMSGIEPTLAIDDAALAADGITKILFYDTPERLTEFQEALRHVPLTETTWCTSKPIFLEFFSRKVSKAIALEKIGALYGIAREEMLAVGDGSNDVPMLRYAGLGIAMANAHPDALKAADAVTASCDEDGVAKAIRDYVLR